MALETNNHKRKGGRPFGSITKFPGLMDAARQLERTPHHLRMVLLGKRESPELIEALKKSGHPLSKHIEQS